MDKGKYPSPSQHRPSKARQKATQSVMRRLEGPRANPSAAEETAGLRTSVQTLVMLRGLDVRPGGDEEG